MERELCFCSDNGCLCNNSVSQAHLRNCFLSADWSQQRWGESTPSSQNAVCPSSLSSGPKWPASSHWCRTASTAARQSSGARRGTAFHKMIRTYWNYRHIWFVCFVNLVSFITSVFYNMLILTMQPRPLPVDLWPAALDWLLNRSGAAKQQLLWGKLYLCYKIKLIKSG